mmetsp:Transcript_18211/g.40200  ORF Transcript_18211/g.40200 Transcript_18211/m.40200 type:complete len:216 (+) Transcript_18211:1425-2072(+)
MSRYWPVADRGTKNCACDRLHCHLGIVGADAQCIGDRVHEHGTDHATVGNESVVARSHFRKVDQQLGIQVVPEPERTHRQQQLRVLIHVLTQCRGLPHLRAHVGLPISQQQNDLHTWCLPDLVMGPGRKLLQTLLQTVPDVGAPARKNLFQFPLCVTLVRRRHGQQWLHNVSFAAVLHHSQSVTVRQGVNHGLYSVLSQVHDTQATVLHPSSLGQ